MFLCSNFSSYHLLKEHFFRKRNTQEFNPLLCVVSRVFFSIPFLLESSHYDSLGISNKQTLIIICKSYPCMDKQRYIKSCTLVIKPRSSEGLVGICYFRGEVLCGLSGI